ncbi:MAG TPA: hypothetical protein VMC61_02370 [Methanocella sp.]|nr:hypothetical protein [Methanocella sp.]
MGLLDLFKPRKLPPPKIEELFKLPPASVAMEQLSVHATGKAGVCFRSTGDRSFGQMEGDIVNILENHAFYARYGVSKDEYGFTWVVIDGDTLQDAVANVYVASQLLIEGGFSDHILAAIFRFDKDGQPIYWIYNYRRASFYPFAPRGNERDPQLEYRLRLLAMDELPVDSLDYWFPIWGIPY